MTSRGSSRARLSALLAIATVTLAPLGQVWAQESGEGLFIRGDANLDGRVSLADVFAILGYLHRGRPLSCLDAADSDDSGSVTTADFVYLLGTLFLRQAHPPQPYPFPGRDSTADLIGCKRSRIADEKSAREERAGLQTPSCDDSPNGGADSEFILFLLQEVQLFPGQKDVRLPLLLDSDVGSIQGITLSLRSDPASLQLHDIDFSGSVLETMRGQAWWSYTYSGLMDAGYLASTLALDLGTGERRLDPVKKATIAHLILSVPEEVPVGTEIWIRFEETPSIDGAPPIGNEIVRDGLAVPSAFCGMRIEIVPEDDVFLRGDVNRNWRVEISDPIGILRYLFDSQSHQIPCADAADVNDNGVIELADTIMLLRFLFTGGSKPFPPYDVPSTDFANTDDDLGCAASGG